MMDKKQVGDTSNKNDTYPLSFLSFKANRSLMTNRTMLDQNNDNVINVNLPT